MTIICKAEDITPNTGVGVLFEGKQVALFRTLNDTFFAVDNFDPFSQANVLARGIIGETAGKIYIASPIYKQRFDLKTGECLDDATAKIAVYRVENNQGELSLFSV